MWVLVMLIPCQDLPLTFLQCVYLEVEFCPLQCFVIYNKLELKFCLFSNANNLGSLTTPEKHSIGLHMHSVPSLKRLESGIN